MARAANQYGLRGAGAAIRQPSDMRIFLFAKVAFRDACHRLQNNYSQEINIPHRKNKGYGYGSIVAFFSSGGQASRPGFKA
jgi:hypothetical protein